MNPERCRYVRKDEYTVQIIDVYSDGVEISQGTISIDDAPEEETD